MSLKRGSLLMFKKRVFCRPIHVDNNFVYNVTGTYGEYFSDGTYAVVLNTDKSISCDCINNDVYGHMIVFLNKSPFEIDYPAEKFYDFFEVLYDV